MSGSFCGFGVSVDRPSTGPQTSQPPLEVTLASPLRWGGTDFAGPRRKKPQARSTDTDYTAEQAAPAFTGATAMKLTKSGYTVRSRRSTVRVLEAHRSFNSLWWHIVRIPTLPSLC